MAIPNPIAGLVTMLKADADVTTQVGTKVFGAELPPDETVNMPQKCIVVSPAGGLGQQDYMKLMRLRVDIKAYGTTPATAWDVFLAARNALRQITGKVHSTVLIHDVTVGSGPVQLRDNDLEWPLVVSSYNVLVSETAVV